MSVETSNLAQMIRLLRRSGVSNSVLKKLLDEKTINDSMQAVRIIDIIRKQPETTIIYEDEEGGFNTEPAYAVVLLYKDIVLSYFSSPTHGFLRIKNINDIDREVSYLKALLKEYSAST
ncbi:hypothetical protein J4526_00245 [Desulfurococcaceae archaeon MEX13E-LK6-19]|nr:hypothetical protein J4526_00245 [Desulfurococcaceae archaeon MEX13E-LK6-19]